MSMRRAHLFAAIFSLMTIAPAAAFACMHDAGPWFGVWFFVTFVGAALLIGAVQTLVSAGAWKLTERCFDVVIPRPKFWLLRLWAVALWGMTVAVVVSFAVLAVMPYGLGSSGMTLALILTTPLVLHTAFAARAWHQQRPR
ncbi:MAG: hypothetical protein H0U74_12425 [Bradymonadaceae bacterium]|nr:hypothetical protein [Lujinxingiaceae bacterium]